MTSINSKYAYYTPRRRAPRDGYRGRVDETLSGEPSMALHADDVARVDAAAGAAQTDPRRGLAILPGIAQAIERDRADARFDAWGSSTVVDENTGEPVLPRAVFRALHEAAGVDAFWPVGNAGLLHVYGYLFSLATTPYGLKRERWLDGALAGAYGLTQPFHAGALGERPPSGDAPTPLERVTESARSLLRECTVRHEQVGATRADVAIGRRAASGPSALAYALERNGRQHLVTTFPVADAADLLAGIDAGPPRLRWNAVSLG